MQGKTSDSNVISCVLPFFIKMIIRNQESLSKSCILLDELYDPLEYSGVDLEGLSIYDLVRPWINKDCNHDCTNYANCV